MRIVAGTWRGRKISAPVQGTRPTLDRARQIAFDILGPKMAGVRVLDLFAGSGALGLEALSRGADTAVFVEKNAQAVRTLRTNVTALQANDRCTIVQKDVHLSLPVLARSSPFDWVFADPPYGGADAARLVAWLDQSGSFIHPDGGLLLEIGRRDQIPEVKKLRLVRERPVGETVLCFFAWRGETEEEE